MENIFREIMKAYEKEYGEDAVFEDDETQVFVLNDCTVIISKDGETMRSIFIGDKPIKVDCTTGLYAEAEQEET